MIAGPRHRIYAFRRAIWGRWQANALFAAILSIGVLATPIAAQDAASPPSTIPEGSVGGAGDINLFPRRVVINGNQRIASIGLYNRTANEGDYEITVSNMVMGPTGQIFALDSLPEGVTADRLQPADAMLRWSPHRVTLLGNEAQTVRIMARPPADLPDGEYRSHFTVVSIPRDVDDGFSIENAVGGGDGSESGIGVMIRPRFGIAIPIIVRVGQTTLEVGLSGVELVDNGQGPMIGLTINRSGNRSAYGDLIATMRGQSQPIALVRGVGVYPEVDARPYQLPLNAEFNPSLLVSGTVITIAFVDDDVSPGATLASIEYTVP